MANIYQDIATRTGGDIYIGVVGPVRTGKSTFIKKFMETAVLPNISNTAERARAVDELPQSGDGKTIMTTEPKFIPNQAVPVTLGDGTHFNVRMVDCVGYVVDNALGYEEEDTPRMVSTPWFEEPIPFNQAAEIGTRKVIADHSTIGVLITTDGTVGELGRADYEAAEARVVDELLKSKKPFVIVVNSTMPNDSYTLSLVNSLEEKYGVPVISENVANLDSNDISEILKLVLLQFPVREINVSLPSWINALENEHWLKSAIYGAIRDYAKTVSHIGQLGDAGDRLSGVGYIKSASLLGVDLGVGTAKLDIDIEDGLFYRVVGEKTGLEITDDRSLIQTVSELAAAKREYDKVAGALEQVYSTGYGIVTPTVNDLTLEKPEIIKQGGKYGIRLKATAPSIHMIRADVQTEVAPIVGTERQSEDLVSYLLADYDTEPQKVWESNIFGKSLHELVSEGLSAKLSNMPQDSRDKLSRALGRIVNEGSGGLFIIIF